MGNDCVSKPKERIKPPLNKTFPRALRADEEQRGEQEIASSAQTLPLVKCHAKKPIYEDAKA